MVTRQQEVLGKRFPHVDLFFDPSDFDQLQRVVPELAALDDDLGQLPHYYLPAAAAESSVTAFVPIIYGCNFLCSYCMCRTGFPRFGLERLSAAMHLILLTLTHNYTTPILTFINIC
jgi:tRNA A37 methylthiotransferase MiaB